MWDTSSGWKWDLFAELLPPDVLMQIEGHVVFPVSELDDSPFWNCSSSGDFTIGSAISILREDCAASSPSLNWKQVWRTQVPQRVRIFLWVALLGRVLTNSNRVARNLSTNPSCAVCGHPEEDIHHVLRKCIYATQVWAALGLGSNQWFMTCPIETWFLENLDPLKNNKTTRWPTAFAITVWWIWKWRCSFSVGSKEDIPSDKVAFLRDRIAEVERAWERQSQLHATLQPVRTVRLLGWSRPPVGWCVLNTDGSVRKDSPSSVGVATCAGVLRNYEGKFLKGFMEQLGSCSSVLAELRGVYRGLDMAREAGVSRLEVRVDNAMVVQLIRNAAALVSHPYAAMIQYCSSLAAREGWEVRMIHCYREENRAADWLARQASSLESRFCLFDSPPSGLGSILYEDIIGVAYPRDVIA